MTVQDTAKRILPLIDLTSLNPNDTDENITALCHEAQTPYGNTAAVCIYPQFIGTAKKALAQQGTPEIKVATVTNFPAGSPDITSVLDETLRAVEAGADEVDMVIPYLAIANGDKLTAEIMISEAVRFINGRAKLKVILESGLLHLPNLILLASEIAIDNGADFIKTSTGKVSVNATRDAAYIMLKTIARKNPRCGFKAAGGIRTVAEAETYLELAEEILGQDWISADHFRFGASSLLHDVLSCLGRSSGPSAASAY